MAITDLLYVNFTYNPATKVLQCIKENGLIDYVTLDKQTDWTEGDTTKISYVLNSFTTHHNVTNGVAGRNALQKVHMSIAVMETGDSWVFDEVADDWVQISAGKLEYIVPQDDVVGVLYDDKDVVRDDSTDIVYQAIGQTSETPPHSDWQVVTASSLFDCVNNSLYSFVFEAERDGAGIIEFEFQSATANGEIITKAEDGTEVVTSGIGTAWTTVAADNTSSVNSGFGGKIEFFGTNITKVKIKSGSPVKTVGFAETDGIVSLQDFAVNSATLHTFNALADGFPDVTSMHSAFSNVTSLINFSAFDMQSVVNMDSAFQQTSVSSFSLVNTHNVTAWSRAFKETSSTEIINIDISGAASTDEMFLKSNFKSIIFNGNAKPSGDMTKMFTDSKASCLNKLDTTLASNKSNIFLDTPFMSSPNGTEQVNLVSTSGDVFVNSSSCPAIFLDMLITPTAGNQELLMDTKGIGVITISAEGMSDVTFTMNQTTWTTISLDNTAALAAGFDGKFRVTSDGSAIKLSAMDNIATDIHFTTGSEVISLQGLAVNNSNLDSFTAAYDAFPILSDCSNIVFGCTNLTTFGEFDMQSVGSMNGSFYNTTSLTTLPDMNLSNVSTLNGTFRNCGATNAFGVQLGNLSQAKDTFRDCSRTGHIDIIVSSPYISPNLIEMFASSNFHSVNLIGTSGADHSVSKMFMNMPNLQCISGLDTSTTSFKASLFLGSPNVINPTSSEITSLESLAGLDYVNANACP